MRISKLSWIAFIYIMIGFVMALSRFFLVQSGDIPNWNAVIDMIQGLPESSLDLILTILFWLVMPALAWPLVVLFLLM
jgi:hypothetical protein